VQKCSDEFYNTQTICWELTEFMNDEVQMERTASNSPEDVHAAVSKMVPKIWASVRNRITRNIILKFYNFFLLPIRVKLWLEMQDKVNTFSDSDLNSFFEVDIVKQRLTSDKEIFVGKLGDIVEVEKLFLSESKEFCIPSRRD